MSAQFSPEPPERAKQPLAHRAQPPFFHSHQDGRSAPFLQLQRALGNRRVAELIQAKRLTHEGRIMDCRMSRIQPKLTVGAADDQYEQEADRVSRQVMSMPDAFPSFGAGSVQRAGIPGNHTPEEAEKDKDRDKLLQPSRSGSLGAAITPFVQAQQPQRQPEEEEPEKEAALQRSCMGTMRQAGADEDQAQPIRRTQAVQAKPASLSESFEAGEDVESSLNRSKGGGSPLPEAVRSFMEPRFGMDFSQVRAHTGADAIQMNRDVGARAFTHGADIYYGAGHGPEDLALTAHELTHVVQQTGGAPLQAERKPQTEQAGLGSSFAPSLQRACSACEAEKKKEQSAASGFSGGIQAQRILSADGAENRVQRSSALPHVSGRTNGHVMQGAWALTETVTNTKPIIGDSTSGNASNLAVALATGVYGKAKSWQVAGFWKIYGGNAHLLMRRDTRYTFVHTGTDNNLLTLRGGASIFGGAEADDLHYAQAGAAVAGNVAVRTIGDPAPAQKSLFPPIHDGGRSEAKKSSIGEVDVSLPVGEATVDVKIPLSKTDEGELAVLNESMPLNWDQPGGGAWKSVDVYLVAYVELAADSENEFWGTDGDVNWAYATAQYNLSWEERVVPAPAPAPAEEGEGGEAEATAKGGYRCWSGRNCEGKAYKRKYWHCHNCKDHESGKSLGEPGKCENC